MPDYTLPFPGRELADQELTYDVCYAKILPQDRASIVERAWRKGEQAAGTAAAQSAHTDMPANNLDTNALREQLKADGVFLEEYKP